MSDQGTAFVKGGFGCLFAFIAIGMIFVMLGGSMHLDVGGACLLFVIGGILGLIVMTIYKRGYQEGQESAQDPFKTDLDDEDQRDRW